LVEVKKFIEMEPKFGRRGGNVKYGGQVCGFFESVFDEIGRKTDCEVESEVW
jgi:hypothetical protein